MILPIARPPLLWRALLSGALAALPAAAADTRPPGKSAEGTLPSGPAPESVSFKVPALGPERLPQADLAFAPAAVNPAALPRSLASPEPAALPPAGARATAPETPSEEPLAEVAAGRGLFDRARSWWHDRLERVPAWPGRPRDLVRLEGQAWNLETQLGADADSSLWTAAGRGAAVVRLSRSAPAAELGALRALALTDIPHARLMAASRGGDALARELVEGRTAAEELAEGPLDGRQKAALADLAARLIRLGTTADLSSRNLVWDKWPGRWRLAGAKGFRAGSGAEVLGQLLSGPYAGRGGLDRLELLRAVRGRVGPDSAAWVSLGLEPLGVKPSPPALVFEPAPASRVFDNSLVLRPELHRRLGGNPLSRPRVALGDDANQSTEVFEIEAPGGPLVVKLAPWPAVRRELFMRKVIARWFGRYFRAPAALASPGGPAVLVMPFEPGGPAHRGDRLDPAGRVALALVAQTFGVLDVSEEHVLVGGGRLPVLVDFEHWLRRHPPNLMRLPDDRILAEMPWVSRTRRNEIEDYAPAIRAWRSLLESPETQAELAAMLAASGFNRHDAAEALEMVRLNAADLDWALQADVEFANFIQELSRRGKPR